MQGTELENEGFTTESSTMSWVEISGDKSKEGMVVAKAMEVSDESNLNDILVELVLEKWEQTIAEKLLHLEINEWSKIEEFLCNEDNLTWSLYDLRSTEIPVQRGCELKDESPIYQRLRRLSPKRDQKVE